MVFAGIIAIVKADGGSQPSEWEVFLGIIFLLIIHSVGGFYLKFRAKNMSKELMKPLEPIATVKRNSQWKCIPANELVPGDVFHIKQRDITPADARLIGISETVFL